MKTSHIYLAILLTFCIGIRSFGQAITNSRPAIACNAVSGSLTVETNGATVDWWEDGYFDNNGAFVLQNTTYTAATSILYDLTGPISKTYRAMLRNGSGTFYSDFSSIEVYKVEGGTMTTDQPTSYLNSGSGYIRLTGTVGTITWQDGGEYLTRISEGLYQYNVTQTTKFTPRITDHQCYTGSIYDPADGPPTPWIMIYVYSAGIITGPSTVIEEEWADLELTNTSGAVLRWEYSTDDGTTWTQGSPAGSLARVYRHRIIATTQFRAFVDNGSFGTMYSPVFTVTMTPYSQASWNGPLINGGHYLKEQQVTARGITASAAVDLLPAEQKHEVITYFDGNGRTVQQNLRKASPSQKDVISASVYDKLGRESKQYLPFVSQSNNGAFRINALSEQGSFFTNGPGDKITDNPVAYAQTVFEKSPLQRVLEQGSVGAQWQPGAHSDKFNYGNNLADEVRLFNPDGSSTTFYTANELTRIEGVDADGKKTQSFIDKQGRVIMSRIQLDETVNGTLVPWMETYYIYSEAGPLKYIVSPKGTQALKEGSWAWTATIKNQYVQEFVYDSRGRLIEKKIPGQEWIYYCYDRLDRLVLLQDGNIRPQNKWFFVKYDRKGRPVQQGLYTNSSHTSRWSMQTNVVDPLYALDTDPYYEDNASTNYSFPTASTEALVINYYDGYGPSVSHQPQGLPGETIPGTPVGMLTYTSRLILGTSTWLTTYFFYDTDGRLIQRQSNNHLNPSVTGDIQTYVYDFEGKVKLIKTYHNAGAGKITSVLNKYIYDHAGRLKQVYQKNNSDPEVLAVHYNYNGLGQLVEKNLHCETCTPVDPEIGTPGTTHASSIQRSVYNSAESTLIASSQISLLPGFNVPAGSRFNAKIGLSVSDAEAAYPSSAFLQSVDLRYNVRGQLASINNASLTGDGVTNDDTNDFFGMEFVHYQSEAGLSNENYFNGNISAVKWKGPGMAAGSSDQNSYKFTYDKANRLQTSSSQMFDGISWTKEANTLNENIAYDLNGNIENLKRYARKHQLTGVLATYVSDMVDDLTYTYNSDLGDQLLKVTDGTSKPAGFDNATSGTANDYTYNSNGSLLSDLNKGISSIVYNALGKAQQVNFTDTRKIEYVYDASGKKLTMKMYPAGSSTPSMTTDYVNGFVYENSGLSFFASPEGRVVKKGNALEYQYAIADHQGNTRIVFSSVTPGPDRKTATFEPAAQADEAGWFQNYPSNAGLSPVSSNNSTSGGTYSQYLHGGNLRQVGVAKSFSVVPGDQVKIEAYARYTPSSGPGNLANFATALLNAFSLPTPTPGEMGTPSAALNFWGGKEATGFANGSNNNTDPKAFVTILLFDRDHNFLDVAYSHVSATGDPGYVSASYTVEEPGYAYLYVSNENPTIVDVYYDDVTITHTPTNIVQYNEYYPFGLQAGKSWTRENSNNDFLYNAGSELNRSSGWYETPFRNYDPVLGRFTSIDPLAEEYGSLSAYHYAGNNPIMINDPTGANYDGGYGTNFGPGGGCNCPDQTTMTNEQWMDHSRPGGEAYTGSTDHNNGHWVAVPVTTWTRSPTTRDPGEKETSYSWHYVPGENNGPEEPGSFWDPFNNSDLSGSALQGGVFRINEVLGKYGYPSREEYLFPKPSFFERLANFGLPLDREDLAEKVLDAVSNEWDLIHQNIDAVDLDRLKLYKNDLWSLRFKLMTQMEDLDKKIARLQAMNWMDGKASEIRGLGYTKWNLEAHLIPIKNEFDQVTRAINFKIFK